MICVFTELRHCVWLFISECGRILSSPDVPKIIQSWPSLAIFSQRLDISMFLFLIEIFWAEVCAFYIVYVKIICGCFTVHLILK